MQGVIEGEEHDHQVADDKVAFQAHLQENDPEQQDGDAQERVEATAVVGSRQVVEA